MPNGNPIVLNRTTILSDQLTLAQNAASVLTPIFTYTVPRGVVVEPHLIDPFVVYLATRETITPAGYATHAAQATALVPVRGLKIAGTAYGDGVQQRVELASDLTLRTITAVADHIDTPSSGTITCSDETNAAHYYTYVPWANGELVVRVEAPGGGGMLSRTILEWNIRTLHEINQRKDGRPLVWGKPLPENFKIVVSLKSTWVVQWTNTGTSSGSRPVDFSDIEIPAIQSPLMAWARKGEKKPGERVVQEALEWVAGH